MSKQAQLDHIIENKLLTPVFQPIVSLKNGSVFGYEALSRITDEMCAMNIEELFKVASRGKRLWDLERLCRFKSVETFGRFESDNILFVNVDGNIIHDPEMKSGYTLELLKNNNINPEKVVFEITEMNSIDVDSCDTFAKTVDHYRKQNFQIAIDDYGSGYSGLGRVCALNPNFLKLDMELVRGIDNDAMKKSAVASTISFCKENSISVIAEGIETEAELNTLIQMGVELGQGYYLARPDRVLKQVKSETAMKIKSYHERITTPSVLGEIHSIGVRKETVRLGTSALEIYNKMKKDQQLGEFFVLDARDQVVGILTRSHVLERFGGMYGYNLSSRMTAEELMEAEFIAVDSGSAIDVVAEQAMNRSFQHIYDAVAITKKNRYISTVTVKELLLATLQIQTKNASDSNPLTGLPGNSRIQERIRNVFKNRTPWSLVYLDIDNFKAYNDAYSFGNGDLMIEALADILKKKTIEGDFCGHVGGDDFVLIVHRYGMEKICYEICNEFSSAIKPLYSQEDWEQGFIISQNRAGKIERFPIASLSVAIITNERIQPETLDELYHIIAKTKKTCKLQPGNSVMTNN